MPDAQILARQLERERRARKEAERLLEAKSQELFAANSRLQQLLDELEGQVRERTEELRLALQDAQRASRVKSDFLAMASHEIRTPMNVVQGMTELLLDGELAPAQRPIVQSILDSSRALLVIINDLLDLSQIEAGKLGLERAGFSLAELVDTVVESFKPRAQAKGLVLHRVLPSGHALGFRGDAGRIRQVLVNLLSNAIKYTPSGAVTVAVEELPHGGKRTRIRCSVTDTGPGLDLEDQGTLFDMFSRLETPLGDAIEGAGLGLAVCRQLVELMEGTIGVESEQGHGSTFWFVLPLEVAETLDPGTALAATAPAASRPLRILVAEDNSANQAVARLMLQKMGHSVDVAGDGAAALRAVQESGYDVVLMDMRMPGMDGLEATRAIRALESDQARVPIIALTANASASDREQCLQAGMSDFTSKPLSRKDLEEVFSRLY
ncbi:MAG TPA: response regulator [Gammaproteobacteria bacterium]